MATAIASGLVDKPEDGSFPEIFVRRLETRELRLLPTPCRVSREKPHRTSDVARTARGRTRSNAPQPPGRTTSSKW